jgi:hypothetical protein
MKHFYQMIRKNKLAGTILAYSKTLLVIVVLLFFSIPKPVSAASNCDLDLIYKDAVHYDPCNLGTSASCTTALSGSGNEEKVWNYLSGKGLKPVAVAGIMGNFYQENSFFDPARKQSDTTKAIPPKGDNSTGYGLAQWTSQGRQALLFAEIDKASLSKYYGAGWGSAEVDKDIPSEDTDKLLSIELDFAWSGDTTKIQDIAGQLNAATTVRGNDGSAVLFHKLYERSGDDASQIKERVDSAADMLQRYAGTGDGSSGSCSTGELGGVSKIEDAIPWAEKFVAETKQQYHIGGNDLGQKTADGGIIQIYHIRDDGSTCWGGAADCHQCTALSAWFVTTKTGYPYGGGNGEDVVGNMKAKGVPTGNQPKPFSVFSYNTGSFGHTGVVLGVLSNGDVITMENNWPQDDDHNGGTLIVRQYNIKKAEPSVTFAYVGDKLKVPGVTP